MDRSFFTVACIIIPICVYMMVLRSGGKERAKVPSKRSFEIPKKDITVESAKAASTVSSGTASASSATTPSKAATPAPSASQQTAPASSTPTSAAKTDTSSAPATKAKAPATAAVATAPTKPATSEAPKATAKPSAEAPKPTQPASKAEAPSTQKSTTESAPVAAPASTKPVEPAKSTEPQKAKPTKPTKQAAKPASHEAASKPFANKEHVAESAIEEATKKTPEPPVKAAPATTSPSEDQLREAAEIEILVDRAAEEEAAKIEELVRPFASQATPSRMLSSSSLPTSYSSTTAASQLLICARLKTTRAMLLQLLRQARQQPNLLRLHSLLHLPLTQMAFLTRMLYSSTSSLARH